MFIRLNVFLLFLTLSSMAATRHVRLDESGDVQRAHPASAFVDDHRVNHLPQKLRAHALEFQQDYNGIVDPDAETNVFSKYLKAVVVFDGIGQVPDQVFGDRLIAQVIEEGFNTEAEAISNFNQPVHSLYSQANSFFGTFGTMLEFSAERGNPIGQYMKGLLLRFGIGMPADEEHAFKLLLASAQSGLYLRSVDYSISRYRSRLDGATQVKIVKASNLLKDPASSIRSYLESLTGPRRLNYAEMHRFESQLYMLPGSTAKHFELYGRLVERLDGLLTTIRQRPMTPGQVWSSLGLLTLSGGFIGFGINRFVGNNHDSDVGSILTGITAQLSFNAIVGLLRGLGDVGQLCSRVQQAARAAFCRRHTTLPRTWQVTDIDHEVRMTVLFLTLHTHTLTNRHRGDMDGLASPKITAVERLLSQKISHGSLARLVMEMSNDPQYTEFQQSVN